MHQEPSHIKNAVVLIFRHMQLLHLMYSEVAWVLVSSGIQVQLQIMLNPEYLSDCISISYDHAYLNSSLKNPKSNKF